MPTQSPDNVHYVFLDLSSRSSFSDDANNFKYGVKEFQKLNIKN